MSDTVEIRALCQYALDSGIPHRVTSTLRPGAVTDAGNPSRHSRGLAVDFAGLRQGRDSDELAAIFNAFLPVQRHLAELIYAGPQVSFNIKAGKRTGKYAQAGHHDHVHVAVDPNVLPRYPNRPIAPSVGAATTTTNLGGAMHRIEMSVPQLDDSGRGWLRLDGADGRPLVPWGKLFSVRPQGSHPERDRVYWPLPEFGEQQEDSYTVLTIEGGPTDGRTGIRFWLVVSD